MTRAKTTEAPSHRGNSLLLTASLISPLIVFGSNIVAVSLPWIGRSLEAFFRRRPVGDQR